MRMDSCSRIRHSLGCLYLSTLLLLTVTISCSAQEYKNECNRSPALRSIFKYPVGNDKPADISWVHEQKQELGTTPEFAGSCNSNSMQPQPAVAQARIEPVKDKYLLIEGVRLHYVEAGSGRPLVLLHGNDGSLEDFTLSIFDKLAERYRVIVFDRPGHGESKMNLDKPVTAEDQARIVHKALQELGIKQPLLVAHSWSGALALSYALQFSDDVCAIVLLGGMAFETEDAEPKASYFAVQLPLIGSLAAGTFRLTGRKNIVRQLEAAFTPDPAPQPYVDSFLDRLFKTSQLKAAARDEISLNPSLRRMSVHYGEIDVPLIIVYGDRDQTVPAENHSLPLHRLVPDSRLIVIHNAGHELQFTRPDEVLKAIAIAFDTASSRRQFHDIQSSLLENSGLSKLNEPNQAGKNFHFRRLPER